MNKQKAKRAALARRKRRVRSKIFGTLQRPRLSVSRSNAHIYAQVVNDIEARTLCAASTLDAEFRTLGMVGSNCQAAEKVGELIGKRALEAGINEVTFDRGGHIYHELYQLQFNACDFLRFGLCHVVLLLSDF